MFTKSSDQIARAIRKKAREDHIKENEDKGKRIDQIDWNTENKLMTFGIDIHQMAPCLHIFKNGMQMLDEKIEQELKKPDDFSDLIILY